MAAKAVGRSDLVKLTRILGLLGSDHLGERASAALAADRLVRRMGTDWWSLLGGQGGKRLAGFPERARIDPWSDFLRAARSRERQLLAENELLKRELTRLRQRL